jgi:hypothetical protein
VDGVVHADEEDARWGGGHVGMPAVKEYGNVMVPVQKYERFLVDYDEEGIKQLSGTEWMGKGRSQEDVS